MNIQNVLILSSTGFFGGVLNSIAGGATLLTFPVLMMVGLPPTVANASNSVALLPSNAAAMVAYRSDIKVLGKEKWINAVVAALGGSVGAALLLASGELLFQSLIPYLLFTATLLFTMGGKINAYAAKSKSKMNGRSEKTKLPALALLFLFSIYGGYFGAGIGVILLALLQIIGHDDFHRANGLKNLLVTAITLASIGVFGMSNIIAWKEAICMMVGAAMGGFVGGTLARKVNQRYLKYFVITFGFVLSFYYFLK